MKLILILKNYIKTVFVVIIITITHKINSDIVNFFFIVIDENTNLN